MKLYFFLENILKSLHFQDQVLNLLITETDPVLVRLKENIPKEGKGNFVN